MLTITSQQNPHIKLIRSLDDKKARREHGLFVAEGLDMLERAAACGWTPELYLATKPAWIWDDHKPLVVSDKIMATLSALNNAHNVLAEWPGRGTGQNSYGLRRVRSMRIGGGIGSA